MLVCNICGMRGDLDPFLHEERYDHWPRIDRGQLTRLEEDELASNELLHEQLELEEN